MSVSGAAALVIRGRSGCAQIGHRFRLGLRMIPAESKTQL
jgi:hypothetical protein